jgi:hypothetical protein
MTIALNHTIVPAHDNERAARLFADFDQVLLRLQGLLRELPIAEGPSRPDTLA